MNNNLGPGHYAECDDSAASTDKDYDFVVDGEDENPVDLASVIDTMCGSGLLSAGAVLDNSGNSGSKSGSSDSSSSSTSSTSDSGD